MGIAKTHPCNSFGWLHLEPVETQRAMQQQLAFRDEELAVDRNASGEPAAFKAWSIEHVRSLAHQPQVADQIAARCVDLQRLLARREAEMANVISALEAEAAGIKGELKLLASLTKTKK